MPPSSGSRAISNAVFSASTSLSVPESLPASWVNQLEHPKERSFHDVFPVPEKLPQWITGDDLDYYVFAKPAEEACRLLRLAHSTTDRR